MKRGKKKSHRARKNPSRSRGHGSRRGRRPRRNPSGVNFRSIVPRVVGEVTTRVVDAGLAVGGKVGARLIRGKLGQKAGTVGGSLIEGSVGFVLTVVGAVFPKARGIVGPLAQGAYQAPIETIVQQLGIPHISDTLADDGYLLGDDVELVSALPGDESVAGYVGGGGQSLAGYVNGGDRVAA